MKRTKNFSIFNLLVVLIVLVVMAGVFYYFVAVFRFEKYVNQNHHFQIRYPADWSFNENVNGATVIFYSPLDNQLDFFKENINIVVQDISASPMTLEEYSKVAVDQMKLVFGKNMEIKELSNTTVNGLPAKKLVFVGKGPQAELKYMSVWAMDNSTVYQLTYLAVASQYDKYLWKILAMINSFKRVSVDGNLAP